MENFNKMNFKSFALILIGIFIIGFSVGYLLGYYISQETQTYLWMYLASLFLGIGSGIVIYGTLFGRNKI